VPKYQSISTEAIQNKRLPIDIESMRDRYVTENEIISFPSPSLETIDKNLFFLLKYSKQVPLDQQYFMRPDYLSFDEYSTVILDQFLMYVNGIYTVEEFIMDTVVIPTYDAIVTICQDKFDVDRDTDDLIKVKW